MGLKVSCPTQNFQNKLSKSTHNSKFDVDQSILDEESVTSLIRKNMKSIFTAEMVASKNIMIQSNNGNAINKLKSNATQQNPSQISYSELFDIVIQCIKMQKIKRRVFKSISIDVKDYVQIKQQDINSGYTLKERIGRGGYGTVYKAICKRSNQVRAIKMISKAQLCYDGKVFLIKEMDILKGLTHPNILKLYDLFQDKKNYYLVTQLCCGGTLLQHLQKKCLLSERIICKIIIQLLSAVKYLHQMNIVHRDIKLENIVFVKEVKCETDDIEIKLIDFGISVKLANEKDVVQDKDIQGTLLYMSPQSMLGVVGLSGDIWSCGIVFYILLTKNIPYKYESQGELMKLIQAGKFNRKNLHHLRLQVKVFLMGLLEMSPGNRITASRAVNSKWLGRYLKNSTLGRHNFNEAVNHLHDYTIINNLISMLQSYLAFKKINQKDRRRLALLFQQIDSDKSGLIDETELKLLFEHNSSNYNQQEVTRILSRIDKNKSGKIDFNEFSAAMYNRKNLFEIQALEEAFEYFDKDHTGYLNKQQIKQVLKGIQDEQIQYIFHQLDKDSNSQISKKQFIQYILSIQEYQ